MRVSNLDKTIMEKDFEKWNKKKEKIDYKNERVFFHEREIWWCSLGVNVGYEQDGKGKGFARPILVFKKFNKEIFWGIPITMASKTGKFYSPINLKDNKKRCAIISQIRLLDCKRLLDKIGVISKENYIETQKAVMNLCRP